MRQALRTNPQRFQTARGASIPAPVGGWDAQSPLAAMPAKNAVLLDNWIPRPGAVEMRRGTVTHATGLPGEVESLLPYRGASVKLFAASETGIYDVTSAGSVSSAAYGSAVNARWQSVNFANDAGRFMICANGAQVPIGYDGSSFSDLTITTGSSAPFSADPATFIDVMQHKRRLWFVEKEALRVWFLETDAIQGPALLLDLGPVFRKGGEILCQGTWTLDSGFGPDDYAVWVTDQGEVAIYQGIDPTSATDWSLVGVFELGLPLSRRSIMKYGSDLVLLTTDGVVPFSQAIRLDRAQDNLVALTQKIQNAFSIATQTYGSNFGWDCTFYQEAGLMIVNVPTSELSTAVQYVQVLQNGSWCRFTGLNAFCWAISDDQPYFGQNGVVYRWDTGSTDAGEPVVGDMTTAFNYFGVRGRQKKFEMLRPIIIADQNIQPAIDMLADFRTGIPTSVPTVITNVGAAWGSGLWDVALWSDSEEVRYDWTTSSAIGYCGAVRVRVTLASDLDPSPNVNVQCIGFDLTYQPGGQL